MKCQLLLFLFYIIHCAIPLPVLQSIIEYYERKIIADFHKMKEIYQNKKENLQNNKGGRNREMTFREQIRNLAGSQSYSRGMQIYNRGKVLRFHIEEAEGVHADENVIIEADVEGSRSIPCVSDVEYGLGRSC